MGKSAEVAGERAAGWERQRPLVRRVRPHLDEDGCIAGTGVFWDEPGQAAAAGGRAGGGAWRRLASPGGRRGVHPGQGSAAS